MSPILIALLVFVAIGLAATWWLRRPAGVAGGEGKVAERGAGQLGALRWRDFAKLVLQAMSARGYDVVSDDGTPSDGIPTDGGDILLERNGEHALLSCKYGSASVVGAQALLGLGKAATLRGASRVIVVTPGRFDDEAIRMARQQDIELIDGEDLWPEVRPYVAHPDVDQAQPVQAAQAPASPKAIGMAWGGAAIAGIVALLLAQGMQAPQEPAATDPATAQSTPATDVPPSADTAATDAPPAIPKDPAELERRRNETANAISTLFGVDRAIWSTQSTLVVYLSAEEADPSGELCPLLERYPELAASRVQLQPRQGSSRPVRFKQCRAY